MTFGKTKIAAAVLFPALIACAFAHASCPVNVVVVKGRVEHVPGSAKVHVQLVYANKLGGDSGEATLADTNFTIPVEFLTQSRRPKLIGGLGEKCNRRPKTVIVTLVGSDLPQEYDRVSLDISKDFEMLYPGAYTLRSRLLLHGPH